MSSAARDERQHGIDYLRGWAVLGVVSVHVVYCFPTLGAPWFRLLTVGRFGVDVFFVISGYLLYDQYRRASARGEWSWRTFYLKRWARLAPPYYLAMLGYTWVFPVAEAAGLTDVRSAVLNLGFLNGWTLNDANSVVPGGWSIGAEGSYAVLFAFIASGLRSPRLVMLGYVGLFVLGVLWMGAQSRIFGAAVDVLYATPRHLPTFLIGVLVWHWEKQGGLALFRCWRIVWSAAGVALLFCAVVGVPSFVPNTVLAGWGGGLLLMAALAETGTPALHARGIAGLGRLSYGVYLAHFALLDAVVLLVVAFTAADASPWLLTGLTFVLVLSLSLPVAWLTRRYVERPFSRLAKRVRRPSSPVFG